MEQEFLMHPINGIYINYPKTLAEEIIVDYYYY